MEKKRKTHTHTCKHVSSSSTFDNNNNNKIYILNEQTHVTASIEFCSIHVPEKKGEKKEFFRIQKPGSRKEENHDNNDVWTTALNNWEKKDKLKNFQ